MGLGPASSSCHSGLEKIWCSVLVTFFFKSSLDAMIIDFRDAMIIDFRERGREKDRNIDWLPPVCTTTRDRTSTLGVCPDRGSNLQPFDVWVGIPTN